MSFEFTLPGARLPAASLGALLRSTGADVDVLEGHGDWPPGLRHVFRREVSTRCVEVSADAEGVGVRVLTCSSPEDYALAVALVLAAASLAGAGEVLPEDREALALAELPARYGPTWAGGEIRSGAAILARLVDEHAGKTLSLNGPNRAFLIGQRLLDELRAAGPADAFADRLVDVMRRTQWPGDCFRASLLEVGSRTGAETTRVAVLSPNSRTLLPEVDLIALHDPAGQAIYVPADAVPLLLPRHATHLDERHLLVEAVAPDEWSEVLRRAGGVATSVP